LLGEFLFCLYFLELTSLEVQYTSVLASVKIRQSFSRAGKPCDNAWSERFFANLKKEAVHWKTFRTRQEARDAIFTSTEGFYNSRRIQKRLWFMSPAGLLKHHLHLSSLNVA
jgi:putative transposase